MYEPSKHFIVENCKTETEAILVVRKRNQIISIWLGDDTEKSQIMIIWG
jgi:hypothetical protein